MNNLWNQLWYSKATNFIFSKFPVNKDSETQSAIVADRDYIKVYLKSLRIPYNRKGISRYYGAVHSFLSLPHLSNLKGLEVNRVVIPQKLKDIDISNIDKVISLNQLLLGPVPFRGGELDLQVGLFSVKSADLSEPFLNVLEGLSNAFGVSYYTAALPFLEPLKQGVSMLTNSSGNTELEIGISRNFTDPAVGYYVAIAANKGELDLSKVSIDENDYSLKFPNGKMYAYILLEIRASDKHETWFQIPEINQAYSGLQSAVRAGNYVESEELLKSFSRIAKTCPDLHFEDGERLSTIVQQQTRKVLPTLQVSNARDFSLPEFDTIVLFDSDKI